MSAVAKPSFARVIARYVFLVMNRYISKSYATTKNAIDRAGAAVVSTITSYKKSTKATLDDQKSVRQKNQSVIQMRVKT